MTVPSGRASPTAASSGIALGDQLFAARPEEGLAAAADELAADAVPLPLGLPVGDVAERFESRLPADRRDRRDRAG